LDFAGYILHRVIHQSVHTQGGHIDGGHYTLGPHDHSVAAMAIYLLPDPVMRRIDLEYCQVDNNRTHWHAKREIG